MERAKNDELRRLRKIRGHLISNECLPLRRQAVRWATDIRDALRQADPSVPDALGARQADVWRPLFAIADEAGGDWPSGARTAALALHGAAEEEGDDGLLLLADIREIVQSRHTRDGTTSTSASGIFTEDLLKSLHEKDDDRPWGEYARDGRPITPRQLAKLLGRFTIKPRTVRLGETTKKGYAFEDLEPAFARYLPTDMVRTRAAMPSHPSQPASATLSGDGVTDVTDNSDGSGVPSMPSYEDDDRAGLVEGW